METMWLEVPGPGVQRGFGDPCGWRGCPLLMSLCGPVSLQRPGTCCWLCTLSPGSQLPSHQTGLLTGPPPSCSSSFVCGCILCLRGQGGNGAGQEECKPEVPGHSCGFFFFFFVHRQPGQNWNRYFLQFLSWPVRERTWGAVTYF